MSHGEIDITQAYEFRVKLDNVQDVLSGESIGSESFLDFRNDFDMGEVVHVNDMRK